MGGGDSLYDKIDRGMRGCKAVVSCVTQKYSLSANCRREISLADALKKPIIPLLLEQIKWPPDGPMSMVFTELLYINFYREEAIQMTWKGDQFDELLVKLGQFVPVTDNQTVAIKAAGSDRSPRNTPAVKKEPTNTSRVKEKGDGTQKKEDETVGKPKSASKDKEVSKKDVDSVKFNSTNVSDKGADKRAIDKRVPSEKAGVGTTIQGSAGSAAGKQTRDTTSDVKSTGKTSTVQKSSAKKAVTVNAFGGSIVKDKVAQDIAAGKRSTTPKSAENSNNIAERKSSTNQISKAKSSDNEGDQKIIGKDTNKEPVKRPSFTDSKVRSKVTAVTAVSKGKVTKSANGTESESAKTNGTPGRGIPTASSKGTTAAKSASSVTSQNAGNKEKVGEEKSRSISQGTNKAGNTTSTPRQTNKATETKQTESDSKQVNGGVNEPKSKSCIIL